MISIHNVHGYNAHLSCKTDMSNIETELEISLNRTFLDKCWKDQMVIDCEIINMMSPRIIKAERSYYLIPTDIKYTTVRFPVGFHIVLRLENIIIKNNPNDNSEYSVYQLKGLVAEGLEDEAAVKYSKIHKFVDFIIDGKMLDRVGQSIIQSLSLGDDMIGYVTYFQGNNSSSVMRAMCDIAKKIPGIPLKYTKSLDKFTEIPSLVKWFQTGKKIVPSEGKDCVLTPGGIIELTDEVPVDYLGDKLIDYVQSQYTIWKELEIIIPQAKFNSDVIEYIEGL